MAWITLDNSPKSPLLEKLTEDIFKSNQHIMQPICNQWLAYVLTSPKKGTSHLSLAEQCCQNDRMGWLWFSQIPQQMDMFLITELLRLFTTWWFAVSIHTELTYQTYNKLWIIPSLHKQNIAFTHPVAHHLPPSITKLPSRGSATRSRCPAPWATSPGPDGPRDPGRRCPRTSGGVSMKPFFGLRSDFLVLG